MVWGATCVRMAVACAHARPMVARLWKKYAARRKVNASSVGSSHVVDGLIFVLFISTHLVTTRPEPICRSNSRISGKMFGHWEDTWM